MGCHGRRAEVFPVHTALSKREFDALTGAF